MNMNPNVSKQQMSPKSSMAGYGAMPIEPAFDGPAPIKETKQTGVMQPNKSIVIPKPGFF